MAATADVVHTALIEIFDSVPDYADYDQPEAIRQGEDAFRLALARLTRHWGEQLLELAEEPPTPLPSRDLQTIDALVERIGSVIAQLNALERARTLGRDQARRQELREADAAILQALEQTSRRMLEPQLRRTPSLWLKVHAAPVYRHLRCLRRDIGRRNRALRATPRTRPDDSAPIQPVQ